MRSLLAVSAIAAISLFGYRSEVLAQSGLGKSEVYGMFGPRVIGESLKPGTQQMFPQFKRDPLLLYFIGVDRTLMGNRVVKEKLPAEVVGFDLSSEHTFRIYEFATTPQPILRVEETVAPREPTRPVRPEAEVGPEVPDIWFRSPSGSGGEFTPASQASGQATATQAPPQPAIEYEIGFGARPPGRPELAAIASRRISRAVGVGTGSVIGVSIQNGIATLEGVVATSHDRTLAAHLARFEPGVLRVDNQLTVQTAKTPAELR